MSDSTAPAKASGVLQGTLDRYGGFNVPAKSLPDNDHDFAQMLHLSLEAWKAKGVRGVWLSIPIQYSSFISIAAEVGFTFHHALERSAVLNLWLPTDEPNKLPRYPFHTVGVGGMVINDKKQILAVREKYSGPNAMWKLPGGMADPKEELGDVAVREVFEECGIKTEFVSMIGFRHFHAGLYNTSDLYFIARLKPLTEEINFDTSELSDARWMDLEEYIAADTVSELNRWVGSVALEHLSKPENTEYSAKVLPTWNNKGTNLFYAVQNDIDAKL